jgi:hypothetical protein
MQNRSRERYCGNATFVRVGIPHLPITSLPYERGAHIPLDDDAKKAVAYAAKEADLDRQYLG